MHSFDLELTSQDIQALHGPDSLAAFLTNLGYDTRARIAQTAANLGIPDPVQRRIKRIELLADHDRFLQVYLFELKSVTVADIKAISRAFRDKAGNFLFVLTADYEYIEFVLLDRVGESKSPTAISTAPPSLVQRRFSVDRRKPTPIHLRVLRRLTWTESDPFGQFDKLRFAYDLAHWSEVYFNNRGLFSDYYLRERLPARDGKLVEFNEWREDPKPAYQRLRATYDQAAVRFPGRNTSELIGLLYEPLLRELGFNPSVQTSGDSGLYLRLNDPDSGALLGICLPYPWGRELDRKDEMHDAETPEITPTFAVVDLLANEKAPWVVLTNGKLWRLYSQRAHSRATNYYEIDLDEVLGRQGFQQDIQDAFRYFWLLFRRQAFRPVETDWQGKRQSLSMLDRLLLGSEEYAKELGENLKNRVFTEVFPVLAEGFIASMRQRGETELDDDKLTTIFQGTLTLLYRLLFLLYAEARDLLPVHAREYREASLQRLKDEIKEAAGTISEAKSEAAESTQERTSCIHKAFSGSEFGLWQRLKTLFGVIDQGSEELNVPRYNGGLFQSKRDSYDHSPEAEAARFLERERIADRHLALALDLLARDEDRKTKALVFVDYKSLGVRQLGSIYEGLLEFRLRIASEKLAVVKEKGREVYKSFKELGDREKRKAEARNAYVSRGHAYLENNKRERKATGSYYTPDHIVKYIVEYAVGPVLQDKFDALRPKLREAQRERREFFKQQEEFTKRGMKPKPAEQAELIGKELVDALFNIKVLDPAMGSGHFLVEAVDFITDKTLEFLNAFPWNPVLVHLESMRNTIQDQMEEQNTDIDAKRLTDVNLLKRHVLKRCIYGVDLNPMAEELAKVSLWLDCFTLGAPLSFLDHHLRWGNSLIGSSVEETRDELEGTGLDRDAGDVRSQMTMFGSRFAGLLLATDLMRHVGEMSDITVDQVYASRHEYLQALDALLPFKRMLDLHAATYFVTDEAANRRSKSRHPLIELLMSNDAEPMISARSEQELELAFRGLSQIDRSLVESALAISRHRRFFHWELEFPEVFYGPRPGTHNAVERLKSAGFDAIIGNPPFIDKKQIVRKFGESDKFWQQSGKYSTATGIYDTYMLFTELALRITRKGGSAALLTPIPWLTQKEGDSLRTLVRRAGTVTIADFSTGSHFEDALVKVVATIVRCGVDSDRVMIRGENGISSIPNSQIDGLFGGQIRVDVPPPYIPILEKIKRRSVALQCLYTPTFGLRACSKEAGEFDKNHLIRPKNDCANPVKYLEARDLNEGGLSWSGKWLDYQPEVMYNARTPELFEKPKVLVPSLLGKRLLRAVTDKSGYYVDQSLVCISASYELPSILLAGKRPSLESVATQIRSTIVSFYFAHAVVGESLGGGAIHATPGLVGQLPICAEYEPHDGSVDAFLASFYELDRNEQDAITNWRRSLEGANG